MSSSSNLSIARRRCLAALTAWPLAALAGDSAGEALAGFFRRGSGEYRRFGFIIYEATLWTAARGPVGPPLALRLTYRRDIAGRDIVDASVREIARLGLADPEALPGWRQAMLTLFPDVRSGDRLLGIQRTDGAEFHHNEQALGTVPDPAFAHAFFAIWLDPRTSAAALRTALLRTPAG